MYTVGQVAEFLGISRDTLKFYEKKDLVRPMKDDENGYRRYSDYDIFDIITINFYRQLDIEIKKIQEIRRNKSVSEIDVILEEKKREIELEIAYKQQLLEKIKRIEKGCADIKKYLGYYTIREMPLLLIKGEISDFLSYEEYDLLKKKDESKRSSITLTDVRRIIYFNEEGVVGNKCVIVEPVREVGLTNKENIIQHNKCIYTIVREGRGNKQEGDISQEVETFLRTIGKEHGYEPLGMVYINILLTTYEQGLECRFLEIYAPIKQ